MHHFPPEEFYGGHRRCRTCRADVKCLTTGCLHVARCFGRTLCCTCFSRKLKAEGKTTHQKKRTHFVLICIAGKDELFGPYTVNQVRKISAAASHRGISNRVLPCLRPTSRNLLSWVRKTVAT
jgi:hypothetical protein